ncbi:MAG: porin family protein [Bacteroidetes bacterium]|nr:porin family protein [Bacteroidota bacterium]
MKKQILLNAILLTVFLWGTVSSFSQNFSVGDVLGMDFSSYSNFSKVKSEAEAAGATVKRNPHVGFRLGIMGAYSFNKYIGLQTEIVFDREGEKYTVTSPTPDGEFKGVYTIGVTYLTIPILFKAGSEIGDFKIYGLLGPYISVGLAGRDKGTSNMENLNPSFSRSVSFEQEPQNGDDQKHLKRLDVGLTIGVEPSYKVGPGDIYLDLRYSFGFLDVQNPYEKGENYYARYNRCFGFSVGYIYTFGD